MSISIGTSSPSTVRDTQTAWLRRREDSRPNPWHELISRERDEESRAGQNA